MTKAQQGLLLIALGVVGAVGSLIWRAQAVEDHEAAQAADRYTEALGGTATAGSFDESPYVIAGAACAVLVLAGVILYAAQSRRLTTK